MNFSKKLTLISSLLLVAPILSNSEEKGGTFQRPAAKAAGERRVQRGPILVIEYRDELFISQATMIVKDEENKSFTVALLQSAFPIEMGADKRSPSLEAPTVKTVDAYAEQLVRNMLGRAAKGAPKGAVIEPVLPSVRARLVREKRDQILKDLGGNFAVVYRYSPIRK